MFERGKILKMSFMALNLPLKLASRNFRTVLFHNGIHLQQHG